MNELWFNRIEKLLLTILSCFVVLPKGVSSSVLIALLVISIVRRPKQILPKNTQWIHLLPPILMLAIWMIGGFAKDGGREIQLWLSWIAAFFYFKSSPFSSWFRESFQWVSLLQAAFFLGFVAYISPDLATEGYSYYLREVIDQKFGLHPTFLTMAWSWAALLFILDAYYQRKLWLGASAIILFTAASFSGGKMPLLAAAISLIIWGWNEIESRLKRLAIILSLLIIVVGNVSLNPVIKERVLEFKSISLDFEHDDFISSTELRLGVWSCALESTIDHWFSGVGLGNTRTTLEDCFKQYNHPVFFDGEYNEHNQYMHVWLAGGILALLVFLAYWVWFKWQLTLSRNAFAYYFLIYFLLNLLTENYLNRQFGMMLSAFMLFGLMEWKKQVE